MLNDVKSTFSKRLCTVLLGKTGETLLYKNMQSYSPFYMQFYLLRKLYEIIVTIYLVNIFQHCNCIHYHETRNKMSYPRILKNDQWHFVNFIPLTHKCNKRLSLLVLKMKKWKHVLKMCKNWWFFKMNFQMIHTRMCLRICSKLSFFWKGGGGGLRVRVRRWVSERKRNLF